MSKFSDTSALTTRRFFYKVTLFLYPLSYRQQFEEQMLLLFDDMYSEEKETYGKARAVFWVRIISDLIEGAYTQHRNCIREKGIRKYMHDTLHISGLNIIGGLLLVPFTSLLISDAISRIVQLDIFRQNKSFYAFLSHTILYSKNMQLLWLILVFFPILAIVINLFPFLLYLIQKKKSERFYEVILTNLLAIGIIFAGGLFLLITFGHDIIPCFFNHVLSIGIVRSVVFCKNA